MIRADWWKAIGTLGEAHNDNIAATSDGAAAAADRRSTLLVFKAGAGAPKAVPLPLVTRLEEIEIARIETASGQMLVQYRGRLMRLIKPDDDMQMRSRDQPVIVFAHGPHVVGVMVDEIIDIVDEELDVALSRRQTGDRRLGGAAGACDGYRRRPAFCARVWPGRQPQSGSEIGSLGRTIRNS